MVGLGGHKWSGMMRCAGSIGGAYSFREKSVCGGEAGCKELWARVGRKRTRRTQSVRWSGVLSPLVRARSDRKAGTGPEYRSGRIRLLRAKEISWLLQALPLATSIGGQYGEELTTAAAKASWPLRIELSCSSFTQAVRAVKTGVFGAALPNLAAVAFAPGEVVQFPLPVLKSYARPNCLAWNPRRAEVRSVVERRIGALRHALGGDGAVS